LRYVVSSPKEVRLTTLSHQTKRKLKSPFLTGSKSFGSNRSAEGQLLLVLAIL